jgi:hypothetical protein
MTMPRWSPDRAGPDNTERAGIILSRHHVFRWIGRHKEFRAQYARAREAQADDILEEILEIADDSSRDYVKKTGADGNVCDLGR